MNAFSEEKRKSIELDMLDEGFRLLKDGGLANVNIDAIVRKCRVSKGSFYSFFGSKAEFIYAIMVHKRNQAKQRLEDFLTDGKLGFDALLQYLMWLAHSDLDIFSHMSENDHIYLKQRWPESYFNNDKNNANTVSLILERIARPRKDVDAMLFANYLKLVALAKAEKRVFAHSAFDAMVVSLVRMACECVCEP